MKFAFACLLVAFTFAARAEEVETLEDEKSLRTPYVADYPAQPSYAAPSIYPAPPSYGAPASYAAQPSYAAAPVGSYAAPASSYAAPPAAVSYVNAVKDTGYTVGRYYCPAIDKCFNGYQLEEYYFKCPVLHPYNCAYSAFGYGVAKGLYRQKPVAAAHY
ncbi:cuticle protein 16.5-like isoform X7 [Artemia franciscana]|uniref:cuticle protein 16.5-like isoform X4 n=1 Tax=Artemia franciscana TaxID=6661 RepID=UPI0032DB9967